MNRKSTQLTTVATLLTLSGIGSAWMHPCYAQTAPGAVGTREPLNFSQLSAPNIAPARLQLKNLHKGWQRITVEDAEDDSYLSMYRGLRGAMFEQAFEEAGIGIYFTKGQSVSMGGETFLVAYHIENNLSAQDIQNMFRNMGGHGNDGPPPGPRKYLPNTTLLLSLLNLRTIGSLNNVRPFDPKMDVMTQSDIIEASDETLRGLGRLLLQMNRYGQTNLPLRDAASMRETFDRYFHPRPAIFTHPQTKEPYRTNAALAKVPFNTVPNRSRVVAIYEARPGTDGKYGTVFLDGHVERVPVAQWKAVRAVMPQKPTGAEVHRLSANNLRQLRNQVDDYTRVRGGKLPSMQSMSALRNDLRRTIGTRNRTVFVHPTTGQEYRPNALLSGKNLRQIANSSRLVALYEAQPGSDGKRGAVFLDGRVERIPAARWDRVRTVTVRMKTPPRKS
jgi:hypothetical protein